VVVLETSSHRTIISRLEPARTVAFALFAKGDLGSFWAGQDTDGFRYFVFSFFFAAMGKVVST
jgi:hypothetical protein